jgi:hypothetical protein
MKKVEKFRQLMAEKGIELTPDEAAVAYRMAIKVRKRTRKLAQKDLWQLELGLSKKEKKYLEILYHARGTL